MDDPLIVEVLYGTGDDPHNVLGIPSCVSADPCLPRSPSHPLLVVAAPRADPVKQLSSGTQVKDQLCPVSLIRGRRITGRGTHVEVVSGLEEVVQRHDVGVTSRDSLEDRNLVPDLRSN